jgi:two-component system sensor histidine kinase AlgZ
VIDDSLLPDFCRPGNLLFVVVGSALLGLFIGLILWRPDFSVWPGLGGILFFTQWIGLLSAALLCGVRKVPLASHQGFWQLLCVVVILPLVTIFSSLIVVRFFSEVSFSGNDAAFIIRNGLLALLLALVLARFLVLQQRWREQVSAETRTTLDSLQARIRPHFLFNALNTIASLIHDRPDCAEEATVDLADMLRSGLKSPQRHPLAQELDLIRGYLRLESLRLDERLQVQWELADDLPIDHEIPPLLIQPLVENAVIHGVSRCAQGGVVRIVGERIRFRRMQLMIENPVCVSDPMTASTGNRTALDNIRQRLELAYDERAGLKIEQRNGLFRATLTLPLDR